MVRIALVKNGVVVNVVVAESLAAMPPIEGCDFVEVGDEHPVSFGWTWDGNTLAPPVRPIERGTPSIEDRVGRLERQIEDLEKQVAALKKVK